MRGAPRTVWRANPLRDDALTAKLACCAENECAVLLEMLIEDDAVN
jgi:hypothetical protein